MLIELTGIDNEKVWIESVSIREMYRNTEEVQRVGDVRTTNIERHTKEDLEVQETPQQIQELILLDEFAKVALGGLMSSSNHAMSSDDASQEAYAIAKSMIEARREALND